MKGERSRETWKAQTLKPQRCRQEAGASSQGHGNLESRIFRVKGAEEGNPQAYRQSSGRSAELEASPTGLQKYSWKSL